MMLFFSVDLENSTRLKQTRANERNHSWLNVITGFIEEFPQRFKAKRERIHRENPLAQLPEPELWKILGDELVFCVEITNQHQLTGLVDAFTEALLEYNQETKKIAAGKATGPNSKQDRLSVKGSAWTAGFPVTNAIIHVQGRHDYVGPSMDLGFRLGRLATPRRFIVSVELAWLLSTFRAKGFHFEGRVELKGVSEATGYPLIWRQLEVSEYQKSEDKLLGRPVFIAGEELADLCKHFILEYGAPNYLPFLKDEPKDTSPPRDYKKDFDIARDYQRDSVLGEASEADPSGAAHFSEGLNDIKSLEQLTELVSVSLPHSAPKLRPAKGSGKAKPAKLAIKKKAKKTRPKGA